MNDFSTFLYVVCVCFIGNGVNEYTNQREEKKILSKNNINAD
jgi:hypothetical protein